MPVGPWEPSQKGCFFDSPHIYNDLVFPDFYEWITFTLDVLKDVLVAREWKAKTHLFAQ